MHCLRPPSCRRQGPVGRQDRSSERIPEHLLRERRHHLLVLRLQVLQETVGADDGLLVGELTGDVDGLAVGIRGASPADRIEAFERKAQRVDTRGDTRRRWRSRLCSASRCRSVRPLNDLSSPGSVPASAGGGGVGVPSTRLSTQSPRLTGLVRSGADVVVKTEPRRRAPPRSNAFAPFHHHDPPSAHVLLDLRLTSFSTP